MSIGFVLTGELSLRRNWRRERASASGLSCFAPFAPFARGLRADRAAVGAAFSLRLERWADRRERQPPEVDRAAGRQACESRSAKGARVLLLAA